MILLPGLEKNEMNIRNPFHESDFFPELTPLIDVMFLLLVFFMLTTTFEREIEQKIIPVELPQAKYSKPFLREGAIVLKVSEKGEYYINEKECSMDALSEVLKISMKTSKDSLVVISAHKDTPFKSIVFIYDVFQMLGVTYFTHEVR